ncbi:MAG: RluA family pseudouridine synthase [Candidatus Paceibacter sp.]|nr:RluA family pseudouridine synthase [Candidatus Paceibacter sp.]
MFSKSDIKIIYQDNDVIAVNKPAGIVAHRANLKSKILNLKNEKEDVFLTDWLVEKFPEIKRVGDKPELRPGIVHRLDKDTSGVLVVAKNQKAFEYLKSLFQKKEIVKKYVALVEGNLKKDKGIIDLPIGRSKSDFRKKLASEEARGELREAITEYKVLEKFPDYTLVEAYPKTGRTHQIRVHFKAIGHPVACDSLYGGRKSKCPEGLNRHFLHANFLELNLPSGARIKLEADLPPDLENALAILRQNK